MKYKIGFVHSDYKESSWYIESPTGKRLWIDSYADQRDSFLKELNECLEEKND